MKVRGYRVELGDVESALRGCAGVREGAVVLRDGRLVAYVVDDGVALPESYASMLRERLPEYMVPSAYVRLESLPLTVNGKLDRSRLPLLDGGWGTGEGYEGPRTEVERRMCAVWEEVLGVERVGIRDNFFSLGGDSGSSIWTWDAARRPVGLLFAGGGGVTFANRMDRVMTALDIWLYT